MSTVVGNILPGKPVINEMAVGTPVKTTGASDIVGIIQLILAVLIVIIVVILFLLALIDLLNISIADFKQYTKLTKNETVLIKDSIDSNIIKYTSNSVENEPYLIYKEQAVTAQIFRLAGYAMSIAILYIAVFAVMKAIDTWKVDSNVSQNETIMNAFPKRPLGIVVISVVVGYGLLSLFTTKFKQRIQPNLKTVKYNFKDLNRKIYLKLYTETAFLDALRSNNSVEYNRQLTTKAASGSISCLRKMLFTLSLYDLLNKNVPVNDAQYAQMMAIFSSANIDSQKIDIISYLSYGKPNILKNVYLNESLNSVIVFPQGQSNTLRSELLNGLNGDIIEINKELNKLKNITHVKKDLVNYMFYELVIIMILLVIFGIMYATEFINGISWVGEKLRSLFRK